MSVDCTYNVLPMFAVSALNVTSYPIVEAVEDYSEFTAGDPPPVKPSTIYRYCDDTAEGQTDEGEGTVRPSSTDEHSSVDASDGQTTRLSSEGADRISGYSELYGDGSIDSVLVDGGVEQTLVYTEDGAIDVTGMLIYYVTVWVSWVELDNGNTRCNYRLDNTSFNIIKCMIVIDIVLCEKRVFVHHTVY